MQNIKLENESTKIHRERPSLTSRATGFLVRFGAVAEYYIRKKLRQHGHWSQAVTLHDEVLKKCNVFIQMSIKICLHCPPQLNPLAIPVHVFPISNIAFRQNVSQLMH